MLKTLLSITVMLVLWQPAFAAESVDVALIGGGIMSATLGNMLHELNPNLKIQVFERLDNLAFESTGTFNNAGTGHAALSELNYTPENPDGTIDISKAIKINGEFELSKEFWAYMVSQGALGNPKEFINSVPHFSWVHDETNVHFLQKRFSALKDSPGFTDMEFTDDPNVLREWMPVIMQGRRPGEKMAATRSFQGTDLDYGRLTTGLFNHLLENNGTKAFVSYELQNLKQRPSGRWDLTFKDLKTGRPMRVASKFVFIGAGGGTLPLLQKSGIPEANGFGGFPIGGEFLLYKGKDLAQQHWGKVYGQAAVGAPPMSVPHLDTRFVNGEKRLLFGPFAGATTRFMKEGSFMDLLKSLKWQNARGMVEAGTQNLDLVRYLFQQETQTHDDRIAALQEFIPNARPDEWGEIEAGIRVQIIKDGVLRFGTEVVTSQDGTLAALLGASPGASISAFAMLDVLKRCFPVQMRSLRWKAKLRQMIPSLEAPTEKNREATARILALQYNPCSAMNTLGRK